MKLFKAIVLGVVLMLSFNTYAGIKEEKEQWVLAWDLFEAAAIKIQQGFTPEDVIRSAECNRALLDMEYALETKPLVDFKGSESYKTLEGIADLKAEECINIFK